MGKILFSETPTGRKKCFRGKIDYPAWYVAFLVISGFRDRIFGGCKVYLRAAAVLRIWRGDGPKGLSLAI